MFSCPLKPPSIMTNTDKAPSMFSCPLKPPSSMTNTDKAPSMFSCPLKPPSIMTNTDKAPCDAMSDERKLQSIVIGLCRHWVLVSVVNIANIAAISREHQPSLS
ncbi:hypothetical protein DPMN_056821 [Dreissena polymorpha]|uniref:Uncharacterized protein n=1 Tax=Dreissena polymorpha TaxID=45954 RepID=A0A9D4CV55_DREPO|nr:hypothetical protein DPMN_056821 [Dreissena polymorpha]